MHASSSKNSNKQVIQIASTVFRMDTILQKL